MLQRKAWDKLTEWKRYKTKQALLITGARQVGKPGMNFGGIYENFVAQELAAHGFVLRYYSGKKSEKSISSSSEKTGKSLHLK